MSQENVEEGDNSSLEIASERIEKEMGKLQLDEKSIKVSLYERIILRDISAINKNINDMDEKKLDKKHAWYKFKDKYDMETYKKIVKKRYASIVRANAEALYRNDRVVPFYVVIDFEATCEAINPPNYKHEIIEFPAVLVNSATLEIVDTFRRICRPTLKPELSEFCKDLTDITQEEIDAADTFPTVLQEFDDWIKSHNLTEFCLVTDGPWDVCRFLFVQCVISCVKYPEWGHQWLDLRKVFEKFYDERKKCSLSQMLSLMGMTFEGRPHCGRDDANNIARLLLRMMIDGARLVPNATLTKASRDRLACLEDYSAELLENNVEGERAGIDSNGKFLTIRDMKVERSRRLHVLIKTVQFDDETGDSTDDKLTEAQLNDFERSFKPRAPKNNKGRKKRFK